MAETILFPGTVEWSGENPGISLKEQPDGAFTTLASFFRVVLSPHGRGHALVLMQSPQDANPPADKPNVCYTDNEPLARYLVADFLSHFAQYRGLPSVANLVYRPLDLPDPREVTGAIRTACRRAGLAEPYLLGMSSHAVSDMRPLGFDANVEFEPQLGVLPDPMADGLKIYDYTAARKKMVHGKGGFPAHPCVMVSWDNTPRRGEHGLGVVGGAVIHHHHLPQRLLAFQRGQRQAQPVGLVPAADHDAQAIPRYRHSRSSRMRTTSSATSSLFRRSRLAPGLSILFIATTSGTPAALAWEMASLVCGITPSSAATTRITMSVALAPRARIAVNAA